jgi:hypothetical protein
MSHIFTFSFWFGILMLIAGVVLFGLGWMGLIRFFHKRIWWLHKGFIFSMAAGFLSFLLGFIYAVQPGMPISLHIAAVLIWFIIGVSVILAVLTPVRVIRHYAHGLDLPTPVEDREDDPDA